MKQDVEQQLPLAPAALHILVALASEDRHGYGIMQEIARQSEGRYKLGSGTLYDNVQRLLTQGMITLNGPARTVRAVATTGSRRFGAACCQPKLPGWKASSCTRNCNCTLLDHGGRDASPPLPRSYSPPPATVSQPLWAKKCCGSSTSVTRSLIVRG